MRRTPKDSDAVVETGGEILADGTLLELVRDSERPELLALLRWNGGEIDIGQEITHDGRAYAPLTLDPTVRAALRLPTAPTPYASVEQLFDEVADLFAQHTDLPEEHRLLLAAVPFASWRPESLRAPLTLHLSALSDPHGVQVLLLLECLCRLPLTLAAPDAADLRTLPDKLPATWLILRPASSQRMRDWLLTAGWQDFHFARAGRLVRTIGVKIFLSDAPFDDSMGGQILEISVGRGKRIVPGLDLKTRNRIAAEFMPQFLQFRLSQRPDASMSGFADASSSCSVPGVVSAFRSSLCDVPQLGERIGRLVEAEMSADEAHLSDPRMVLLDVLLARCHEAGRQELHVAEISLDVNAVLTSRGERGLTDRKVGSLLKSLGLRTQQLDRHGRGIELVSEIRTKIHQLAVLYEVLSVTKIFPGCAECARASD